MGYPVHGDKLHKVTQLPISIFINGFKDPSMYRWNLLACYVHQWAFTYPPVKQERSSLPIPNYPFTSGCPSPLANSNASPRLRRTAKSDEFPSQLKKEAQKELSKQAGFQARDKKKLDTHLHTPLRAYYLYCSAIGFPDPHTNHTNDHKYQLFIEKFKHSMRCKALLAK